MRKPVTTHDPLEILWQAPAIMWMLLTGEGVAIVLTLAPAVEADRWSYFGMISLAIQWISLSTLATLYVFRGYLSRLKPHHVAYIAIGLLLVFTLGISNLVWLFFRDTWSLSPVQWHGMQWRLAGIVLAVGLLGLAAFQSHWRGRLDAVRAKQAELESLRARIRPHFLFNTLNTAAALVHQRPEAAEQILLDLADLFRAALSGPREILLEDELALTRRYVEIESLRFSDRLSVCWRVPERIPAATLPTLSIQPLVENAIRHGVELSPTPSVVDIWVDQQDDVVRVTVRNELPADGTRHSQGHKIGQASTRARIEALAGERGRLETRVEDGRYVATIVLPQGPGAPLR